MSGAENLMNEVRNVVFIVANAHLVSLPRYIAQSSKAWIG
jgi:hypothetical protein